MAEKTDHSLLSDMSIKRAMAIGSIIIEPFSPSNLATTSYDVTLGPFFFRETNPEPGYGAQRLSQFIPRSKALLIGYSVFYCRHLGIYNPYSKDMVDQIWGSSQKAESHKSWAERTGSKLLDNIGPEDLIIWIKPGETILGHTMEYIGGRNTITTMMKARSSMGRNFIEVCKVCHSFGFKQALSHLNL